MAATAAMTRKLPGRIVGETKDDQGNRAFVLTLQARDCLLYTSRKFRGLFVTPFLT